MVFLVFFSGIRNLKIWRRPKRLQFQLSVVRATQKVLVTKDEPQLAPCQVPKDKQDNHGSGLDDLKPIATPFESNAEFQEDEGEDAITLECSWVPPISEDESQEDEKFQEEEPRVNQVDISQQGISSVLILVEASSLPITIVVREKLDMIPLQQQEPLLVQPEDDVPYTLPMIMHLEIVLQDPEID